uniref:Uncharacterized protein n=1 Tax=Globodera pallida TaxID=36090 RepID=A0A183BRM5_GLOPA
MDLSFNDKVGFINNASKQLENRLAEQNQKLHELMKRDVNEKSSSSHFDEGNRRGSTHNFEKHSSSESRPAPYSDSPKPVEYFRDETTGNWTATRGKF